MQGATIAVQEFFSTRQRIILLTILCYAALC